MAKSVLVFLGECYMHHVQSKRLCCFSDGFFNGPVKCEQTPEPQTVMNVFGPSIVLNCVFPLLYCLDAI